MASQQLEFELTKKSTGYLSKDDYTRGREELQAEKVLEAVRKQFGAGEGVGSLDAPAAVAAGSTAPPAAGNPKKRKKEKKKGVSPGLSFGDELEDEEGESSQSNQPVKKMGKCHDADVGFLQKNEREMAEHSERAERAMRELLAAREKARNEPITLSYTYRSEVTQRELPGGIHRGEVTGRRGDTADAVARLVRTDVERLGGKFKPVELAGVRDDRDVIMVGCCEGFPAGSFVLPASMTLIQLAELKWHEGAPLFDDFAPGIVVTERRWYEANRHVYPYSHWHTYETSKSKEYSRAEFISQRNSAPGRIEPRRGG